MWTQRVTQAALPLTDARNVTTGDKTPGLNVEDAAVAQALYTTLRGLNAARSLTLKKGGVAGGDVWRGAGPAWPEGAA
ncbi:hypothetical protein HC928_10530, partial [bacterium]|nr:hypothetical protein [bacterium]